MAAARDSDRVRDSDAECLLCEPCLSLAPDVAMVLRGGQVCTFGPELREVFYRVLWREYGVGPTTLETMARAGTLATSRLPHPCGELCVSNVILGSGCIWNLVVACAARLRRAPPLFMRPSAV